MPQLCIHLKPKINRLVSNLVSTTIKISTKAMTLTILNLLQKTKLQKKMGSQIQKLEGMGPVILFVLNVK
jgi:hypothetical protein